MATKKNRVLAITGTGARIERRDVLCIQWLDDAGRPDGRWEDYSIIRGPRSAGDAIAIVDDPGPCKRLRIVRRGDSDRVVYGPGEAMRPRAGHPVPGSLMAAMS